MGFFKFKRQERTLIKLRNWMIQWHYDFDDIKWKDRDKQLVNIYKGGKVVATVQCTEKDGFFYLYRSDNGNRLTSADLKGFIVAQQIKN